MGDSNLAGWYPQNLKTTEKLPGDRVIIGHRLYVVADDGSYFEQPSHPPIGYDLPCYQPPEPLQRGWLGRAHDRLNARLANPLVDACLGLLLVLAVVMLIEGVIS